MGIYAGVNGVRRQATRSRAGVNGAVRTVSYGFNGMSNVRRQFFGPLEDVASVELRPRSAAVYDIDSNGNLSNCVYVTLAQARSYGSISISANSICVQGSVRGKYLSVWGDAYALFSNGREVLLPYLSEVTAKYGASISFPLSISLSISSRNSYGWVSIDVNDNELTPDNFTNSYSGASTLYRFVPSSYAFFTVSAGMDSGSGTSTSQLSVSSITIDGRNVPVRVVSQLT